MKRNHLGRVDSPENEGNILAEMVTLLLNKDAGKLVYRTEDRQQISFDIGDLKKQDHKYGLGYRDSILGKVQKVENDPEELASDKMARVSVLDLEGKTHYLKGLLHIGTGPKDGTTGIRGPMIILYDPIENIELYPSEKVNLK